jgi:hypothetical protein
MIGKRFFILDNSGSTSQPDGHVMETNSQGKTISLDSSRWDEIRAMAVDQAEWNAQFGVPCEFILLNPPEPKAPKEGRDFFTVDPTSGDVSKQVSAFKMALRVTSPMGPTPLSDRVRELTERLSKQPRDAGSLLMLTVVTDGVPTDRAGSDDKSAFVHWLKTFAASFRSFIVIRLATDDDDVVDYYNKMDEDLELPLDILDDICGEAKEVYDAGNKWLTYSPLVHRVREGGSTDKLFDLLDERPFLPTEIHSFLQSLLLKPSDPPLPREPNELFATVSKLLAAAPLVYDGRTGRMAPPVNLRKLKSVLVPSRWKKAANMMRAVKNWAVQN